MAYIIIIIISDIRKWMAAYFLFSNSDKTEMLVLGPKQQRYLLFDLTINLNGWRR
jgi:hypothetical protein